MEGDDDSVLSTLSGGTTPLRVPPARPGLGVSRHPGPGLPGVGQLKKLAVVHHAVRGPAPGQRGEHDDHHDGRSEGIDDHHRASEDDHDHRSAAVHDYDVRRDGRNGHQQCHLHHDDRAAPLSPQCG